MNQNEAQAELNTRVKEAMSEAERFVDNNFTITGESDTREDRSEKYNDDLSRLLIKLKGREAMSNPLYTQEMADNGELPPAGAECDVRYVFDGEWQEWAAGCLKSAFDSKVWFLHGDRDNVMGWHNVEFRPLPTKTPEELAIEDIEEVIAREELTTSDSIASAIYDKGYRKQMPEDEQIGVIMSFIIDQGYDRHCLRSTAERLYSALQGNNNG